MGAADDVVSVQVTAEIGDYVANMKTAAGVTTDSTRQMSDSLRTTATASTSLTSTLRDFKQEATQASRVANFYARDLMAIVPGAGSASFAVKEMIAALISGGTSVAGFALIVGAIAEVSAKFEEQKKIAIELRQVHSDVTAQVADMYRQLARNLDGSATKSQTTARQISDQIRASAKTAGDASRETVQAAGGFVDSAKNAINAWGQVVLDMQFGIKTLVPLIETSADQVAKDWAKSAATVAAVDELAAQGKRLKAKEEVKLQMDASTETIAIRAGLLDKTKQIDAQYQLALAKLSDDGFLHEKGNEDLLLARIAALNAKRLNDKKIVLQDENRMIAEAVAKGDEAIRTRNQKRLEEAASLEQQITAIRAEMQGERFSKEFARAAEEIQKRSTEEINAVRKAQQAHVIDSQEMESMISQISNKASRDRVDTLAKEYKKEIEGFVRPLESAFTGMAKSIVDGTKTPLQALEQFATNILGSIIDGVAKMGAEWVTTKLATVAATNALTAAELTGATVAAAAAKVQAISTTAGNIAMAATAAASAVAGVPFVGPALAAAAFAETAAVLTAGAAPYLATAKGGMGSVPFDDMPFLLHKREMVMPEPLASGARNLFSAFSNGTPAPSGGNGGGDSGPAIHVHVHEHYGPGVIVDQHSMDKHYSSPEFQTSIDRAIRTGKARFK